MILSTIHIQDYLNYITNQESRPCVLKDCSVVIDATNFLYNMYRDSGLPFAFGCESDKFAAYMKERLNMFKDANVKCYFVFKGGDSSMVTRFYYLQNETDGEKLDFMEHKKFVPPLLMMEVYKQVLDELGVPYAVCEYDSKRVCVALAEQLKCAVISNHMAFSLMKAPYISYRTLKYNLKTGAIESKLYNRANFLKKHSLTEQKLAIFVVLANSNRISTDFYNDLLDNLLNKLYKSFGALHLDNYKRYIALWRWLSKRPESAVLNIIYQSLNKKHEEMFASEMHTILEAMQTKRQSLVADYLWSGGELDFETNDPNWFEKGVISSRIAKPYINLYYHEYLIRVGAVESTHSRTSMLLSMDIVKYAFNLLTDFKRDEFTFIIGREEVKMSTKRAAPAAIQTPAFVNGWNDIKELRLFEKFLEDNSISAALLAQAPGAAAVLLAALVYFARRKAADDGAVQGEVYTVIACFAMLADNRDIPTEDGDEAADATRAYFAVSRGETERIFDREMLHNFVEFQHCLQQLNYLNALCGSPLAPTVYHRAYNGTFVYKLYHEMARDGDDCTTFINKLFNRSPSVLNYINKLIGLYEMLL